MVPLISDQYYSEFIEFPINTTENYIHEQTICREINID